MVMRYEIWGQNFDGQTEFLSFWTIFVPLPPNNPKNQNFEKMTKTPGDIIILHKFTKNHDHVLHCSEAARDGCI